MADTLGTSRTLAYALRKEGFDLVLCGCKSTDSETWQVPPEVAAFLGVPHLTSAIALEPGLRVRRVTDEGEELWRHASSGPGLAAASSRDVGIPRGTSTSVEQWGALELVDEVYEYDHRFGQSGSPTRVLAVRDVTPERAQFRADSAQAARAKIDELLDERAPEAPPWEKPSHAAERPAASYECWTLIETRDGEPTRTSLELLGRARTLAGKLGGKAVALVLGDGAPDLGRRGAELATESGSKEPRGARSPRPCAGTVRTSS